MQTEQDVVEGFRLSPQQKHLWLLQESGSLPFRSHYAALIEGGVDAEALRAGLELAVSRNEILRTTFRCLSGLTLPLQIVEEAASPSWEERDLRQLAPAQRDGALRELVEEAARMPFDLERGPLLRVWLARLSDRQHLLLLSAPALVMDGVGLRNLVRVLASGENLEDEPAQYADLTEWQNELLESDESEPDREAWRRQDFSALDEVRLPFGARSVEHGPFEPQIVTSQLDPALAGALESIADRHEVPLSALLLACWRRLLSRLTGRSDLIIGTAFDGRSYEGLDAALGLFGRYLPLRLDSDGEGKLRKLLRQTADVIQEAHGGQEYFSWELLGSAGARFAPFCFELQDEPAAVSLGGASLRTWAQYSCIDRFTVKLACVWRADARLIEIHYDASRIDRKDAVRMAGQAEALLRGVAAGAGPGELDGLGEGESHQLLAELNDTQRDFRGAPTVQSLFEEQAAREPDRLAVVCEDVRLTRGELNLRANRLAHHLRSLGAGPEVAVAICLDRSVEIVVALLAVLKAGSAYLPLDPSQPPQRLALMLDESGARVVVTEQRFSERFAQFSGTVVRLDGDREALAGRSAENPVSGTLPENLAYILFTSGSTGRPKGVAVEHRQLSNYLLGVVERIGFGAVESFATVSTFAADLGNTMIFPALCTGGCLRVVSSDQVSDAAALAESFGEEPVGALKIVPSHLEALLSAPQPERVLPRERLVLGGEALRWDLVSRLADLNPDCAIFNHYGPTETTVGVLTCRIETGRVHPDAATVPLGRPLPNSRIFLVEPGFLPVPTLVPGELYIGGEGLARGYLGRPDLTAERFVPDPLSGLPGARLYRTGDVARYLPDGQIEFLGRADNQVKIRGFRIELGEIEATLRTHPGVREAVVLAREDSPGEKRLVAYVVVSPDSPPSPRELRGFLQQSLAEYMVPSVLMPLKALPLNANGKVDRQALPQPSADPGDLPTGRVEPRTLTEEVLAAIWSELLGRERLSVEDSFFEMGGHSLLATQMVGRLRTAFGVEVPLRVLFELPTIAGLAAHIEGVRRAGVTLAAPPLEPVSRDGSLPLSFAQQRLWFIDQWEPGGSAYNIPVVLQMNGRLNEPALEGALNEIVRRHESLRTVFESIDGEPVQRVRLPGAWALSRVDLSGLGKAARDGEARRLVEEEVRRPFDLSRGPLFRISLLRLGDEENLFLGTMHHIVSDGWSMGVLTRELGVLYHSFSTGVPSPLPDLPIQYADFAHWQRRWLTGAVLESEIRYWREQLAGAPPVLELPTDRPRPAVRSFYGARELLQLTPGLTASLQALGRRQGVTAFMLLLAAFQALLSRYTGQDDLVVGTPIAGRNREETENLIGFFVNTLVLRTDASEDPPFLQLLDRVRAVALSAHEHQDLPFEKLVEEIEPERSLSYSPLFQVMFTLQNARTLPGLPGLELQVLRAEEATAKFDLSLAIAESTDGMRAGLEYNTDLFDGSTISRMLGHFRILLEGIAADPERRLLKLPLLAEEEEAQLAAWSVARDEWAGLNRPIHHLIEEQAARRPEALALVPANAPGRALTYRELDRQAGRLARRLTRLGLEPEMPVGVCLERSPELVIGMLAILKAGGVYLPLDPAYPRERLAFMLEDAGVRLVLSLSRLAERLPQAGAAGGYTVVLLDREEDDDGLQGDAVERPIHPENLAYLIYTSGSTGRPKGVAVQHGAATREMLASAAYWNLGPEDRCLHLSSPSFDSSLQEVLPALLSGSTVVVVPQELWEPASMLARAAELELTVATFTTAYWAQWARECEHGTLPPGLRLRTVIAGGEAMAAEAARAWRQTPLGALRLLNGYGPTEIVVSATWCDVDASAAAVSGSVPIGRPLAGHSAHVLDQGGNLVPLGVSGELFLGGLMARGYLGRPELTAERFLPDPFSAQPGARLYRTGDLVRRLPQGDLQFLGRVDHQVKIRGFRIELGEIESALAAQPGVREVVVLAREDQPGDKRLMAYVVRKADAAVASEALRSSLKQLLPDYMVPSGFVILDALPLTPGGKVDRRALGLLGAERTDDDRDIQAPRDWAEEVLASIWCEVLGLKRVGIDEDFFALGGHSLLATQVVSRAQRVFGVAVLLRELFEFPTIAGLAATIESRRRAGSALTAPPLEPVPRSGRLPLSFAQQRLWFLDQWIPGDTTYNIPAAVRLEGPLRPEALQAALGEIVRRHESLRTTFESEQGEPVQRIHPAAPWVLPVVDLAGLGEEEREAEARRLRREAARHRFDLARGPLLWAGLLQLGKEEHVLLATMHHIVSDGWSRGVLTRELGILYEALSSGAPSPLPEPPIQYPDFAVWQRRWLSSEVLEAELGYWRSQLGGAPAVLDLLFDRPRPPVQSYRGASIPLTLAPALAARIQEIGRRAGATAFMTLLAVFKTLLGRYAGREDLSVGTPVAGRNRVEIEELIGFFVNMLVLRTSLSGDPSFKELLGRVREVALAAQLHQDLPFEKLVEELDLERSPSHSPLFQVLFTMQNVPRTALKLPGLTLQTLPVKSSTAKFDLSLVLWDNVDGGLSGALEYSADLFEERTVRHLLGHFEALLDGIVASPDQRLSELPLLRDGERAQLLAAGSGTVGAAPRGRCLRELFEEQAAQTPDALALVAGEERLSYRELDERASRLARHLRSLGVEPEVVTGLCVGRSSGLIVGMLGILKAGGVYLPLDPAYPLQRRAYMLRDSGARVLLTERALLEGWDDLPGALRAVCLDEDLPGSGGSEAAVRVDPAHLAYLIYTSGSTGEPKGVGVANGAAADHFEAVHREFGLGPQDRVLQFASSSFDVSLEQIFATFAAGASLVLRGEEVPDPVGLSSWLVRSGVTVANLPTAYWRQWVEEAGIPAGAALRLVIAGGEAMSAEAVASWAETPVEGVRLLNAYGPTEAVITATVFDVPETGRPDAAPSVPIGRPLALRRAHVLDRYGHLLPAGVPGELCLGGLLARGYLGRPGATAERFVPDPFGEPGGRLYRTGDLAVHLPDGNFRFLGRVDQQVKVRGYRIELQEIEALLGRHPAVQEAMVLVKEEGAGVRSLIAFVAMPPDASAAELRGFLRQSLPDYMVPNSFVVLDRLPLTPNGKVDRAALLRLDAGRLETRESAAVAETPVQELLAGIWCEVLGRPEIGVDQNFFDLGGHSLLATRVVSRVRDAFHVEIPVRALFESPTVARLAAAVESLRRDGLFAQVPPITRVPRVEPLPLSFAQQRLWFLDQWEPGVAVYNLPSVLRIEGPLRPDVLESALGEIVRRHESLRTAFEPTEREPVQTVRPVGAWVLPVMDLGGFAETAREEEVRRLVREEVRRPFDLTSGTLFRALLLRLGAEEHVAVLTLHHIASDGWSLGVMTRELEILYKAGSSGSPSPLPELPIQYADFAAWQRRWLAGERLDREIAYWREQLAGMPAVLDLPADRPRPVVRSLRGAREMLRLPGALVESLQALGRAEGATLFMVLLAGFDVLLGRQTGSDDLGVGTPIAGRNRVETENLIGFFVNTLVLRGDLSGDPTFRELLARVREVALAAHAHEDLPFEKLVEELEPERGLSHSPLFQVMFALQNAPARALDLPGLTLRPLGFESSGAKFDLTLSLVRGAEGLHGALEYSTDLYDVSTVRRMLGHLETLLRGIAADPGCRIAELPLLTEGESRQLLQEWNPVRTDRQERCLHTLFREQAERSPDAVAVSFGEQRLSYRELDLQAGRLARRLRRAGVKPDAPVALCLDRSLEMVVGILGILKAGGLYVPLDPSYPPERLAFLLEDSRAAVLVTQSERLPELPPHDVRVLLLDDGPDPDADAEGPYEAADVTPGSGAYLIYTSGSTGTPKGVLVTHANVVRLFTITDESFRFGAGDVWTLFHSYAFDFSVWEIWGALLYGGRLVVVPYLVSRSPDAFHELLRRERVTVLNQTPSAFRQLIQADQAVGTDDGMALRLVIFGGEALEIPSLAPWWARHGDERPLLVNMYGITETTVHVTWRPLSIADLEGTGSAIGVPIPDLRVYLLDRGAQLVPVGVPGEVHVGGAGLARGYFGRPELTAQRFVPDPFGGVPGERLYRAGDLARRLPDGELEYLGRIDNQVKIRGFRIEIGEIESVLSRHPSIGEGVVLVREDTPGDRRLVAYVVKKPGAAAGDLREFLKRSLPEYMVPAGFVELTSLPLNTNGKVDRRALLAIPLERPGMEEEMQAPRTWVEELLAEIWAEVLGAERVGVDDDFFQLGGHSLLATQVVSRVRKVFGVDLALRELFESPKLGGLAAEIERKRRAGSVLAAPPLEPVARREALPLSFAQQRLWFLDQWQPGSPAYNIPTALRMTGSLRPAVLEAALGEIVRRHESLRTVFESVEGEPVQKIRAAGAWMLPSVDLGGLPGAERESETRRLARQEARRPFDLSQGPLFRGCLLRLDAGEHVLLGTMHHIVSDGWSMGVLTRELGALYRAFCEGAPSPLPELPIQYVDYAHWQRAWLSGEVLAAELGYWREQLAGMPPVLSLPTDRPRPSVRSVRGGSEPFRLTADLTGALQTLGRAEGATPFMMLLAAFQALLGRSSGREDVSVGTPIAGRNRVEIEGLIGFFVNTLVLRTDLSGDPSFRELLGRVREVALAAHSHQDLPFEKLVEELEPERSPSHTPLFQVMFMLQNAPAGELDLPGVRLRSLGSESSGTAAKFDLTLTVAEVGGTFQGAIEYNVDLFDAASVRRMAGHFAALLEGAVAEPGERLSERSLLTPAERRQLAEWNGRQAGLPGERCLHELFEEQAARTPDAVALAFGEERLSYRELDRLAERMSRRLRSRGVGPDVLVGLGAELSPGMVVGLLGILKAGGAYVPLDPAYPRERLAFMVRDTGMPILLVGPHWREILPEFEGRMISPDDAREAQETGPGDPTGSGATPGNLAYVIYTSGSTGQPKGVMISHQGVVNYLTWCQEFYRVGSGSGAPVHSSPAFDLTVTSLLAPLLAGRTVTLLPEGVEGLAAALAGGEPFSLIKITPAHLDVLKQLVPSGSAGSAGAMVIGGEALHGASLAYWREHAPATRFINEYGPTETVVGCCVHEVAAAEPSSGPVPIGRPIDNVEMHVLDPWGQPSPAGVPGELHIGGAGLARGYLGRPDLTAERFVPDPWSGRPGARLYRTGDLASWRPDGCLEFRGRTDHQIKIRGFRIELGEIEVVLGQHPAVREATVLAREDSSGDRRLVAYVTPRGAEPAVEELVSFLRERLPEHMVPSAFVLLEALPLTSNGKVDRGALPAPERARSSADGENLGPRDGIELELVRIWEDLLGVAPIGVTDDFFELGGHSLLAVRLLANIQRRFGQRLSRDLSLAVLFQGATIEGLARVLRREGRAVSHSSLIPLRPTGSGRPFFVVHPVGGNVFCYLDLSRRLGSRPVYGLQSLGWSNGAAPERIEGMASLYVEEMRKAQPEGPYLLGGWSFGGVVAFEMARQLEEAGQEVSLLALIDSFAPQGAGASPELDEMAGLLLMARDLEGLTGRPLNVSLEGLRSIGLEGGALSVLERARAQGSLPPDADVEHLHRLAQVYQRNLLSLRHYLPREYAGSITLFRAEPRNGHGERNPADGWTRLAARGVAVHPIPGDHYTAMRAPHVDGLARALQACLDEADPEEIP